MDADKTLPGRYYTDPEYFQDEVQDFYTRDWICAGRAEFIPHSGDYFLREVAGESVIVLRDSAGEVRAFFNVCRHRGTRLCERTQGNVGARIQCPYHGWTYGLDGRLTGAPHMGDFERADYPLHPAHVDEWAGHLFLHLGEPARTLQDQLGELPAKFVPWPMAELRLHRRIEYEVRANWKLIVANYNECLHCPLIHPALNRLTDYLGAENEASSEHYFGGSMGFRPGIQTMSADGKRRRAYLPGLDPTQRGMVCYWAILPNLLLSLHPDYMMVHTLWPLAADATRIDCEFFFHPEEMAKEGFEGADAIEFWDMINREDWHICERSQAGISSRAYSPGPYSERESLLHAFDRIVVERERRRVKSNTIR